MSGSKGNAGPAKANKKPAQASSSAGESTSAAATVDESATPPSVAYGQGKPDKALYDAEQDRLKAEIDALQVKMVCSRVTSSNTLYLVCRHMH